MSFFKVCKICDTSERSVEQYVLSESTVVTKET